CGELAQQVDALGRREEHVIELALHQLGEPALHGAAATPTVAHPEAMHRRPHADDDVLEPQELACLGEQHGVTGKTLWIETFVVHDESFSQRAMQRDSPSYGSRAHQQADFMTRSSDTTRKQVTQRKPSTPKACGAFSVRNSAVTPREPTLVHQGTATPA